MTRSTRRDTRSKAIFKPGDLVVHRCWDLVYLLVPRDYGGKTTSLPYASDQKTLVGVVVHSQGRDDDGDKLPAVGYFHTGFSSRNYTHFNGTIDLTQ